MYSLNRSMIENLIILSFIVKHGEPAAEIFVANGAVEFEKMRKKILEANPDFDSKTQTDRININRTVSKIRDKYSTLKLGKEFMWANSFLNKGRNDRSRLGDIALDVGMTEEYYNLTPISSLKSLFKIRCFSSLLQYLYFLLLLITFTPFF